MYRAMQRGPKRRYTEKVMNADKAMDRKIIKYMRNRKDVNIFDAEKALCAVKGCPSKKMHFVSGMGDARPPRDPHFSMIFNFHEI